MTSTVPQNKAAPLAANRIIIRTLEDYLHDTGVRHVDFSDRSTPPPDLAYVTTFPRLSIPLKGCHSMEIARRGRTELIKPSRGHAVFVPDHAWNKPDWASSVEVLTFLFGVKQIGFSLVRHERKSQTPSAALKTSVSGDYDVLTHSILTALKALAVEHFKGTLPRLLTESLLHSCLLLLKSRHPHRTRKAVRTYESICLYVQENFHNPITRDSVAHYFGLAPNHVSRLFKQEGLMRFNDYVNLVRVNRAKFMLQNYPLTLKEIASRCGYNDTAYFCRVFRKTTRGTPTQYRADSVSSRRVTVAAAALPRGALASGAKTLF